MARCAYCGVETQLFVNGTPVCVRCDQARQPEMPKSGNNGREYVNDRRARQAEDEKRHST
jgi:hypothetical protein